MGFVFFVLKGFEKEKIERFDRLWVSKRNKEKRNTFCVSFFFVKWKRNKAKRNTLYCFFFLCFFFFFLFETHNLSNPQFFPFQIPSMHKTQNPNHHWLIFKYKSLSLFLFLFLSHISVSLLDQWRSLVEGNWWFGFALLKGLFSSFTVEELWWRTWPKT